MRTISTRGRASFAAIRRQVFILDLQDEAVGMMVWGRLEHIAGKLTERGWVQIRTVVPRDSAILRHIIIGNQTRILRGIEPASLANLREGEIVGSTFLAARAGVVTADTCPNLL